MELVHIAHLLLINISDNMFRVRYRKHLNLQERGALIALTVSAGHSHRSVASTAGCSRKTVKRWRDRYEQTGDIIRKPGSGRRSEIDFNKSRMILQAVTAKPITTAEEISG